MNIYFNIAIIIAGIILNNKYKLISFLFMIMLLSFINENTLEYIVEKNKFYNVKKIIKEEEIFLDKDHSLIDFINKLYLETSELLISLSKKFNIQVVCITKNDCVSTPMRTKSNIDIDKNILDIIKFDKKDRYTVLKKRFQQTIDLMSVNKENIFYNLYTKDNCVGMDTFLEVQKKYSEQLLSKKIDKQSPILDGKYWMIKHKNNIYILFEEGGIQTQNLGVQERERKVFYRKFKTIQDFKNYRNGYYFRLFQEFTPKNMLESNNS